MRTTSWDDYLLSRGIDRGELASGSFSDGNNIVALRSQGKLTSKRRSGERITTNFPAANVDIDLGALLDADRGRLDA
jgi:hypothetical protein